MARLDDRLDREFDPRTAKALATALGVRTVGDLLRHYPRRYERRGELTDLASLRDGDHVTVLAQIAKVTTRPMRNRRGRLTEVTVTDGHGSLTLAFFGQPWREKEMKPGLNGLFAGQVSSYGRKRQLIHPDCELLGEADPGTELAAEHAAEIIPVYPAASQLPSWKIAKAIRTVLDTLDLDEDPLPARAPGPAPAAAPGRGPAAASTARMEYTDIHRARIRLKWDEAFVLQTVLAQRRRAADALPATPASRAAAACSTPSTSGCRSRSPRASARRAPTSPPRCAGSTRCTGCCRARSARARRWSRSGPCSRWWTTAARPCCSPPPRCWPSSTTGRSPRCSARSAGRLDGAVLDHPGQATRVALLTGSQGARAPAAALDDTASGAAGIVIGTHTLLYHRVRLDDQVVFKDLGLVVIDEQHRFGVEQRDALREKAQGSRPHVLVMTATPIPRTVAMTVYGDLDVCTLSELPAGRTPISTHVVPGRGEDRASWSAPGHGCARRSPPAARPTSCARASAVTETPGPFQPDGPTRAH